MGKFSAGQGFGARQDDDDGGQGWGSPLVILLGSLGAAIVVGLLLMVVIMQSVDDDGGNATAATGGTRGSSLDERDGRVILSVKVDGSGSVEVAPLDVTCREFCSQAFAVGTRVVITADAAERSRFTGWGGACTGRDRCTIRMADDTTVTATFDRRLTTGEDEPLDTSPVQGGSGDDGVGGGTLSPDCTDGRDNDGDGLTDAAQDPDCEHGAESRKPAAPPPPPPPPPPATTPPAATPQPPDAPGLPADDCSDGRDNDGDGLTDAAQDPNCRAGQTEAGMSRTG